MNRKVSVIMLVLGAFVLFNAVSCSKSGDDNDGTTPPSGACAGTKGPLYTSVENLIKARCVSCHGAAVANGGVNFEVSCSIVDRKARIKVRVVDEGTMPQTGSLPQSEKDIISAWINAGGLYTN